MLPPIRYFATPRAAMTAVFIAYGIGSGLWAGSIPSVMRNAAIDSLMLGLGITFYGIAYVMVMSSGGTLARFASNRAIILTSLPLVALNGSLLLLSASPVWFLTTLVLFGAAQGVLDLFMNAEASYVESDLKHPIFTSFHAAASAGMALFALIGSLFMADASPLWTAAILCIGMLMMGIFAARRLPARYSAMARISPALPAPRLTPLIILGLAAGLAIAGETAAIMWSAKLLDEQAPSLAAIAGLGTAFYGLCNTSMRLAGDTIRARFGDIPLILGSLLLAATGFVLIGISGSFALSTFAFALTGLGTACVIPAIFAITARHMTENRARGLGIVSLVAGLPRVLAPWFFGWVATQHSTSFAFGLCALAMAVALGLILLLQLLLRRAALPVPT
jgi:predicted MFS family arabinose efflux permease